MRLLEPLDFATLDSYVRIILLISLARGSDPCPLYSQLDSEREKLHNELLKQAKVDRSDDGFALALALYVEDQLKRFGIE